MGSADTVETTAKGISSFRVGDTVVVETKVVEGERERLQSFQGVVIGKRGGGVNETFTVRRISHGEGVERIFPLCSPLITRIEVLKRGQVRRAKLYYLRQLKGKKGRIQEVREGGSKPAAVAEEGKKALGETVSGEEEQTPESGADASV